MRPPETPLEQRSHPVLRLVDGFQEEIPITLFEEDRLPISPVSASL